MLRVVRGEPSSEELAALVTVLAAVRRGVPAADEPVSVSRWRRSALPRPGGLLRPGPGAWRASAFPGA